MAPSLSDAVQTGAVALEQAPDIVRVYQSWHFVPSSFTVWQSVVHKCKFVDKYELLLDLNREARGDEATAHLLAVAYTVRMDLLNVIENMRLDDPDGFRESLRKDDVQIMQIFRNLVSMEDGERAVLSLKTHQRDAEGILNLIDRLHDDRTLWHIMCGIPEGATLSATANAAGNDFKHTLNRIDVKLTIGSDLIPSNIIIQGISLLKDTSERGGAYSDVYEGQDAEGTKVAVKKLRTTLNANDTRTYTREFCKEASMWKRLKHPNVLEFLGVNFELFPRSLCLVSHWAENDHIMKYIHTQGFLSSEVHRLLYETARGLAYLHMEKIVHGDLRTPNILIDGRGHVRVADFGLSSFADSTFTTPCTTRGYPKWSPPETYEYDGSSATLPRPTYEADMFAFSAICWEVHSGQPPFDHLRQAQAMMAIYNGKRPQRYDCPRKFSETIWKVMTECWHQNPSARPSARAVAARLEMFSSIRDRQHPTPPPYLHVPATVQGSRRRSIEDLRSEASSPSHSDRSAEDTVTTPKPPTPPPAVLRERRSVLKRPATPGRARSESNTVTVPRDSDNPRVRFGGSTVVPTPERTSSSSASEGSSSATAEVASVPSSRAIGKAAPIPEPPPLRKSSKPKSPRKNHTKPEVPMYLNQTNHYIPRPLLRDSGIMGPGDNTINPLEPMMPSSVRALHEQYAHSPVLVYGNPYLPYMPIHPINNPSIQAIPSHVIKPGDNTINPLEPVIPPYPGTSSPMFGVAPNMHYSMYP